MVDVDLAVATHSCAKSLPSSVKTSLPRHGLLHRASSPAPRSAAQGGGRDAPVGPKTRLRSLSLSFSHFLSLGADTVGPGLGRRGVRGWLAGLLR